MGPNTSYATVASFISFSNEHWFRPPKPTSQLVGYFSLCTIFISGLVNFSLSLKFRKLAWICLHVDYSTLGFLFVLSTINCLFI